MTRRVPPDGDPHEAPDPTADELHALYRASAADEPAPDIDRRIVAAAHAELRAAGVSRVKRRKSWWTNWLPATSAIAIAVLGVSLAWQVSDDDAREVRSARRVTEGSGAAQAPSEPQTGPAQNAPATGQPLRDDSIAAEASSVARPLAEADASGAPRAFPAHKEAAGSEAATSASAQRRAPAAPAVASPQSAEARSRRAPLNAAPAGPAPHSAAEPVTSDPRVDAYRPPEAGAPVDSSARSRPLGKREAGSAGALATDPVAPAGSTSSRAADDAATPEAWLAHIRELRAAGRDAEAAQSFARLRARYPEFAVPDEPIKLK